MEGTLWEGSRLCSRLDCLDRHGTINNGRGSYWWVHAP